MFGIIGLGFATFVLVSYYIGLQINTIDPLALQDEKCHIPQALLFCDGIYNEWSPKITTLPGLYIFSLCPIKLLQNVMDVSCSVVNLRMFNLVVNSLNFIFIHYVVAHYHSFLSGGKRLLITMIFAIMPLNYFFTFLYYTDPLATLFLLVMHLMWIRKSYNWSAVAGFCAVLTRQTSIVWVAFHGMLTIHRVYSNATLNNNWLTKERDPNSENKNSLKDLQYQKINARIFYSKLGRNLLDATAAYLIVGLIFMVFVYINDGIVVGDREEHTVNANFPQILYFSLFTGILTLPHLISQRAQLTNFALQNKFLSIFIFLSCFFIVLFNTVAHHYNLNDPHHFTHHFLNYVYYNTLYALSLVPLYTICWLYIIDNSVRSIGKFMTAMFFLILAANLIPQLLLEFRYYVPGFLIFRMKLFSTKWRVLLGEFAVCLLINTLTISLFLIRPTLFPLDNIQGTQILMW